MQLVKTIIDNFRLFDHFQEYFTEQTVIRGKNGQGKSSIKEAIVWCLYGTNVLGKTKADLTLIRDKDEPMRVLTEWETKAGETVTVERFKPKQGATVVLVNGLKAKPGQVERLFLETGNDFLSVFSPGFFSGLQPKDARAVLAHYAVLKTEDIVKKLAPQEQARFENVKLGMGYDSIEIFRKRVADDLRDIEDEKLRVQGQIQTFEEALANDPPMKPETKAKPEFVAKASALRTQLRTLELQNQDRERNLPAWKRERVQKRNTYTTLRANLIHVGDTCPTCKQALSGAAKENAETLALKRNQRIQEQLTTLEQEGTALTHKIEALENAKIPTPEELKKWQDFVAQVDEAVQQDRINQSVYDSQKQVYDQAKTSLQERKQQLSILEKEAAEQNLCLQAIKRFRGLYVSTQQKTLDSLFDKVRIILTKVDMQTGEIRDVFSITWNEKPYQNLSHSEKIRCDIEIGRAIAKLRNDPEPMPVFVDDAEGVDDLFNEAFDGQVIAAYRYFSDLMVQALDDVEFSLEDEVRQMQALLPTKPLKKGA